MLARDLCNIRSLLSCGGASIFQFLTSPPFCSHPLPCCEAAALFGERRKLSGGGAQTDNALCTRKTFYRSRVSNTSRVFNRSQGQRGLLLEVLRYNVNVKKEQESCAIAKMTAQRAPYMGALKIFETPSPCPRLLFPN